MFLFLFSCTVTKRVHRPGYHIEWKKNYRVQKEDKTVLVARKVENKPSTVLANSMVEAPLEVVADAKSEPKPILDSKEIALAQIRDVEADVSDNQERHRMHVDQSRFHFLKSRTYFPIQLPKAEKRKSASSEYASDGWRNVGFVLLGLGGFLLMGSLIAFFGFWALEEIFYSLVFSGNGFIAGILGLLLFLLILIVVFIAYAIVRFILGGAYVGFVVSFICIGAGLLSLLIAASI